MGFNPTFRILASEPEPGRHAPCEAYAVARFMRGWSAPFGALVHWVADLGFRCAPPQAFFVAPAGGTRNSTLKPDLIRRST